MNRTLPVGPQLTLMLITRNSEYKYVYSVYLSTGGYQLETVHVGQTLS